MAQQQINLGTSPSGQDGDDARTAFTKVNENFTEVYAGIGEAQPTNPKLTAIAASVWAANQLMYTTGPNAVAMTSLTDFARSILDDADAAAVRATLGGTVLGQALFTATSEASARASLQLGTAATYAVTTSNNDATAGRVTKVGDFGIGGAAVVIPNATAAAAALDVNNVPCGKYHLQLASETWRDLPSGEYALEVTRLGGSGGCVQKATHYSTGVQYERRIVSQNFAKKELIVGDFGLGSLTGVTVSQALLNDNALAAGIYRCDIAAGGYLGLLQAPHGLWQNRLNNSGATTQIAIHYNAHRLFFRGINTADFQEALRRSDVVGTVSTSANAGAIIERGSNANGDYTRYADGTQICGARFTAPALAIDLAHLGGFRSAQATWSFPMSFTSPPTMVPVAEVNRANGCVSGNVLSAQGGLFFTNPTSQISFDRIAHVTAYGRWF